MNDDLSTEDYGNALVANNVRAAIKKALSNGEELVPALFKRITADIAVIKAGPAINKIHRPHKVHNKSTGEWRVEDDDGHVYGKFKSEGEADKQLAALYEAKAKE